MERNNQWFVQASRYLQSGLVVYALDLTTFSLLNWIAPEYFSYWTVTGRLVGAAAGFILHHYYSFAGEKVQSTAQSVWRYILLLTANAALSVILLNAAVEQWQCDAAWARPVIDILIIALAFVISKFWVFKTKKVRP